MQHEAFVSTAWRHAFLKHIDIAAAGSNREHAYIAWLFMGVSLIDVIVHTCTLNIILYAAMPASSGAPVLFDTCTIAGVHTGALFHLDDEYIKTDHYEVCSVIHSACE